MKLIFLPILCLGALFLSACDEPEHHHHDRYYRHVTYGPTYQGYYGGPGYYGGDGYYRRGYEEQDVPRERVVHRDVYETQ